MSYQSALHNFLNKKDRIEVIKNKFYEYRAKNFNGFDNISNEAREELQKVANSYKEKIPANNNRDFYYTLLYILGKENPLYDNYSAFEEKMSIVIEAIDPKLRMFKLYKNSSPSNNLKLQAAIINEFGFYDENIFEYERLYARRFFNAKEKLLAIAAMNDEIVKEKK